MADQNPSDAPSLPPIPMIPFQGPPPDQPAPSTPTEMAAASLSSSVDNDMPISEVVAALKSAPQTPAPAAPRSEAQIPSISKIPGISTGPAGQPGSPVASASPPPSVTTTVSVTPPPRSEAQIPRMPAGQPAAIPKGPLYEDPDLVKVPGTP